VTAFLHPSKSTLASFKYGCYILFV
jgi:hypothetical protein